MSIRLVEKIKIPEVEGEIGLIYGGLGGGKTYAATCDILSDLRNGVVVFATWPINFTGDFEAESIVSLFLGVCGLKSIYRVVPKENFHYVPLEKLMDNSFIDDMETLTDCALYVDEGYAAKLFDSYQKTNMSSRARMSIYGTRHFNRKIIIVAQRPNAIHVSSRSMVNRFFRCEQPLPFLYKIFGIRFFIKTEYQDMLDETVDETKPVRSKWYFGSKRVFKAYNSKYLRGNTPSAFPSLLKAYKVSYEDRWVLLLKKIRGMWPGALAPGDRQGQTKAMK